MNIKNWWISFKDGAHKFVFGDDDECEEFVVIQTKDFQLKAKFSDTLSRTRVTDFIIREYRLQGDYDISETENV